VNTFTYRHIQYAYLIRFRSKVWGQYDLKKKMFKYFMFTKAAFFLTINTVEKHCEIIFAI